jgi:hypothetical protein
MNSKLLLHLWKSPELRAALKKEVKWPVMFVCFSLLFAMAMRYFTDRPFLDGLDSLFVSLAAGLLVWVVSVFRTIRHVMRENSLL